MRGWIQAGAASRCMAAAAVYSRLFRSQSLERIGNTFRIAESGHLSAFRFGPGPMAVSRPTASPRLGFAGATPCKDAHMSDLSALVKETPVAAGLKHRIVEVTDHAELARHVQPWEQLIEQIAEPNVFYAPWALLPAVRHLRGGQAVRVLLFYQDAERGQLDGVIPLFERTCGG